MKKQNLFFIVLICLLTLFTGCSDSKKASVAEKTENVLTKPGVYSGNFDTLTVSEEDIILEDVTAKKIIITKKVGDGDVTLRNVDVATMEIYGGGANSIHLEQTRVDKLVSNKEDGIVRVVVEDATSVRNMDSFNTLLVVKTGGEVSNVTINANADVQIEPDGKADVITVADQTGGANVAGAVNKLNIAAPKAEAVVTDTAKVTELNIEENAAKAQIKIKGIVENLAVSAAKTKIEVDQTAVVSDIKVERKAADTHLKVEGRVEHLNLQAAVTVAGYGKVEAIETRSANLLTAETGSTLVANATVIDLSYTAPSIDNLQAVLPVEADENQSPIVQPVLEAAADFMPSVTENIKQNEIITLEVKPSIEVKPSVEEKPAPEVKPPVEEKPAQEVKPPVEEKPTPEEKPPVGEKPEEGEKPSVEEKPIPEVKPPVEEKPSVHIHDFSVVVKEEPATCIADGEKVTQCSGCEAVETETFAATGHTYDDGIITTEAACTDDGVKTYTCRECEDSYTTVIEAYHHTNSETRCRICEHCQKPLLDGRIVDILLAEYPADSQYAGLYKDANTENQIIYIADKASLFRFAELANAGQSFRGMTIKLAADIDLTDAQWMPIGNENHPFTGTFDGASHMISNMTVSDVTSAGFFGYVKQGKIINLIIDHAYIQGSQYAGGIAGCFEAERSHLIGTGIYHCEVKNTVIIAGDSGRFAGHITGYLFGEDVAEWILENQNGYENCTLN